MGTFHIQKQAVSKTPSLSLAYKVRSYPQFVHGETEAQRNRDMRRITPLLCQIPGGREVRRSVGAGQPATSTLAGLLPLTDPQLHARERAGSRTSTDGENSLEGQEGKGQASNMTHRWEFGLGGTSLLLISPALLEASSLSRDWLKLRQNTTGLDPESRDTAACRAHNP